MASIHSKIPKEFWLWAIKAERHLSRETKFLGWLADDRGMLVGCGDGQWRGKKKKNGEDKWFISYHSQPVLIKTSWQMHTAARETSWLRTQCLWNVKIAWLFICCLDLILWIPLHPLILLQALCILRHKEQRNIWVLVWTSVMNPSNILFPSKVIFNFIAVCLCILPNNRLDKIPTGKTALKGPSVLRKSLI